jgi:glutamate dehydrogenase
MVRRAVYWLLHRYPSHLDISRICATMQPCVRDVLAALPRALSGFARRRHEADVHEFESLGIPASTAQKIANLRLMTQTLDIAELAIDARADAADVARLHFELGRGLRLDWIREQIEGLESQGHWRAMARGTLRETLGREQQKLVANVLGRSSGREPGAALGDWMAESNNQITRMKRMFDEMQTSGQLDFATLSIALKEISRLS